MNEIEELNVDGDIVMYRCGFAGEHKEHCVLSNDGAEMLKTTDKREANAWVKAQKEPDLYDIYTNVEVEPLENTLHSVKIMLEGMMEEMKVYKINVFITGDSNFREVLSTSYKANRDHNEKPTYLPQIKEYLIHYWDAVVADNEEADDLLGIHQRENTCICTTDKDLDMIQGWHYNFVKKEKYYVSAEEATRIFYKQVLQGDFSTDNIPGLYQLTGKKCTQKILSGIDKLGTEVQMWNYVKEQFKGIEEEDLLTNSRLLWIRKEPLQVWQPPLPSLCSL